MNDLVQILKLRSQKQASTDDESTTAINAPVTPGELGQSAVIGAGAPYVASHIPLPLRGYIPSRLSALQALGLAFGPAGTPVNGAFELLNHGMAAANDSKYKAGKRSYIGALATTVDRASDEFRNKGLTAEKRYGYLGSVPLRLLHGVLNPIAGTTYAIKQLGNVVTNR